MLTEDQSTSGPKFLVVEDIPDVRETIIDCLKGDFTSSKINSAEDGVEALEICHDQNFDIIVTDFNMPNMNGIDFIKNLRSVDGPNKETPIIILTGFSPDYDACGKLWQNIFFLEKISDLHRLPFYVKAFLFQKKSA